MIEIREELAGDIAAVRDVNRRAFEQDQEANIVDALRSNEASSLSLVATVDGRVVGHIMYSPITVGQRLTYYPRFGFKPASVHGITCEWEMPDNVFMLLVLDETKMEGVSGLAKYRPEFSTVA